MSSVSRREWLILVIGDVVAFYAALYLTLLVRYLDVPTQELLISHLPPFTLLFVAWLIVFVIAGLYGKHTLLFKRELPGNIVAAQIANVLIAAAFFFLVSYFNIAPKTNLFIYLIISSILIAFWRLTIFPSFGFSRRDKAVALGSGKELAELVEEVNGHSRYRLEFVEAIDLTRAGNPNDVQQKVLKRIAADGVSVIVANMRGKDLDLLSPLLYNLSFVQSRVELIDFEKFYEEVFERIPVSLITYDWLLENIRTEQHTIYSVVKRSADMILALMIGIVSLPVYPLMWLAVKLDDGGPLFIVQERVGKNQRPIRIHKFRSMSGGESDSGKDALQSKKIVTRVGKFIRVTRLDELPQIWSVLRGDQSLVGPRPELPSLGNVYAEKIPFYNARYMVQPGLSGWAQIYHQAHPHHGTDVVETKIKLAYDLYYIKHRSIMLDLIIALQTVKTLLSVLGK